MLKNQLFNPVFSELSPSSTLYINETVNAKWSQGEQVFHMGFGESRFDVHPILQRALAQHADKKSYLPARGLPPLCEQVATYYQTKLGIEFGAPQVMVGPGSKLLIYGLQTILDADLFLPTPSWVSYAPQATILGRRAHYISADIQDDYRLHPGALEEALLASDNPNKLLLLNSPNNPSGGALDAGLLQEVAGICRANDVIVLSDEIYFQLCFNRDSHISIASYYPEGTAVLGGLSKHLSLGGWRLGVALMPGSPLGEELMQRMVVFASETWSSVAAPVQYAALQAYGLSDEIEDYVRDCCNIHAIRTRHIRRGLQALGIHCCPVEGAFYIAANFDEFRAGLARKGVHTSSDLSRYLLQKHAIASLPGIDFGIAEQQLTLRLSTSYLDMESAADPDRIYQLYRRGADDEQLMAQQHHPVTAAALSTFAEFIASLEGDEQKL
ncbi:MAG: aminotransferase class I/II-fold pyridoxal phosphate-dependent enzyme [Gammaproteobacteria bacterium]|nr:aminotransferase class I/II-fold pyridoxal phosphate-dependent enzyme [Gammaproteobacteria bacterium]